MRTLLVVLLLLQQVYCQRAYYMPSKNPFSLTQLLERKTTFARPHNTSTNPFSAIELHERKVTVARPHNTSTTPFSLTQLLERKVTVARPHHTSTTPFSLTQLLERKLKIVTFSPFNSSPHFNQALMLIPETEREITAPYIDRLFRGVCNTNDCDDLLQLLGSIAQSERSELLAMDDYFDNIDIVDINLKLCLLRTLRMLPHHKRVELASSKRLLLECDNVSQRNITIYRILKADLSKPYHDDITSGNTPLLAAAVRNTS